MTAPSQSDFWYSQYCLTAGKAKMQNEAKETPIQEIVAVNFVEYQKLTAEILRLRADIDSLESQRDKLNERLRQDLSRMIDHLQPGPELSSGSQVGRYPR